MTQTQPMIKITPPNGVTGPIRFDANGDPLQKSFAVGVIQNGTIQLRRGTR